MIALTQALKWNKTRPLWLDKAAVIYTYFNCCKFIWLPTILSQGISLKSEHMNIRSPIWLEKEIVIFFFYSMSVKTNYP